MTRLFLLLLLVPGLGCSVRENARAAYGDGKRQLGLADRSNFQMPPDPDAPLCSICKQPRCNH